MDDEDLDQKSTSTPSHSLGSPPAAGTTAISPATSSMSSNKKRKLYKGMSNNDNNDDNDVETLYPHLSCTRWGENDGFDLTNPSILKSMQALLTELTHIFSTEYELKVKDIAKVGHEISYVRVPRTSSDRSFQNSKAWLNAAIQIAGSSTRAPSNLSTTWQITSSASTKTQSSQIVKPNEYQSANL
jgi:hypothetical protein